MPSFATVSVVAVQFGTSWLAEHSLTVVASSGKYELPAVSLASGEYTWLVSYSSSSASGLADGAGGMPTVTEIVEVTARLRLSCT